MGSPDEKTFESLLLTILHRHIHPDAFQWLQEKADTVNKEKNSSQLHAAFAAIPRKAGKSSVEITQQESEYIHATYGGFSVRNWPADRLCRLWLLMKIDDADKDLYLKKIESLFQAAEINELVALYASLITFKYPDEWRLRCSEGIRSNIGNVLEAIMYDNPYPSIYLDEPAWNQLVLKAFFTDKDVNHIVGLDKRANRHLASILVDYAHERWAAQRTVNPLLWRLVAKFIDESNFADLKQLYRNGDLREKKAAVLACYQSDYEPAKKLVDEETDMISAIKENTLRWDIL